MFASAASTRTQSPNAPDGYPRQFKYIFNLNGLMSKVTRWTRSPGQALLPVGDMGQLPKRSPAGKRPSLVWDQWPLAWCVPLLGGEGIISEASRGSTRLCPGQLCTLTLTGTWGLQPMWPLNKSTVRRPGCWTWDPAVNLSIQGAQKDLPGEAALF